MEHLYCILFSELKFICISVLIYFSKNTTLMSQMYKNFNKFSKCISDIKNFLKSYKVAQSPYETLNISLHASLNLLFKHAFPFGPTPSKHFD